MTRRERLHENIREEIKTMARQQMAAQGSASVTLRAIARDMELSAPALYRYYASRDDLISALIMDAFQALGQSLREAYDHSPADAALARISAPMLAYRDWAITHPIDFLLIFGSPIPDYQQTPEVEAATGQAAAQLFSPILAALEAAIQTGALHPPEPYRNLPPALQGQIESVLARYGYPVSVTAYYMGLIAWVEGHGLIMLELTRHIQPAIMDVAAFYRDRVDSLLHQFGASTTV